MLIIWCTSCRQCGSLSGRHADAEGALDAIHDHWRLTGHRTGILGMVAEDVRSGGARSSSGAFQRTVGRGAVSATCHPAWHSTGSPKPPSGAGRTREK